MVKNPNDTPKKINNLLWRDKPSTKCRAVLRRSSSTVSVSALAHSSTNRRPYKWVLWHSASNALWWTNQTHMHSTVWLNMLTKINFYSTLWNHLMHSTNTFNFFTFPSRTRLGHVQVKMLSISNYKQLQQLPNSNLKFSVLSMRNRAANSNPWAQMWVHRPSPIKQLQLGASWNLRDLLKITPIQYLLLLMAYSSRA